MKGRRGAIRERGSRTWGRKEKKYVMEARSSPAFGEAGGEKDPNPRQVSPYKTVIET